ncbi:hypothetical protein IKF15_03065 [Candidatus Saccharibacteria bacterium]|nr:hypothetical protein [Candidatus Saccharibacteria bacterium]
MNVILNDRIIHETKNFIVCAPKTPHIPREDGGHIWIRGRKNNFCSRLDLDSNEAIEVMRLTMLISEAMINGMKNRNINIGRINYQDNGNWAYRKGKNPIFHIHLYGRTINSKTQVWGEALVFPNEETGFYDEFEPFNDDDIKEIKKQIAILENTEKYSLKTWNLK